MSDPTVTERPRRTRPTARRAAPPGLHPAARADHSPWAEDEGGATRKEWLLVWIAIAIVVVGIVGALVIHDRYDVSVRWPWDKPADPCAKFESALLRDLCHLGPKP